MDYNIKGIMWMRQQNEMPFVWLLFNRLSPVLLPDIEPSNKITNSVWKDYFCHWNRGNDYAVETRIESW